MSRLPAEAEAVVVGGGAVGTSVAFHLAEAGVDTCLLERDALSSGSTSRAAGGVRTQFSDPLNVAIGQFTPPMGLSLVSKVAPVRQTWTASIPNAAFDALAVGDLTMSAT